jgi:hypothetical protein
MAGQARNDNPAVMQVLQAAMTGKE